MHSYRSESSLRDHELVCEKHNHCEILMPSEKLKILKYIQGSKSLKMTHIISVDIECILVKHDICANNTDNSYTKTISTRVLCGYRISVNNEFKANYHTYYRGKDCMEKLSKELIKIGYEIANEEKQEKIFLTKDEKLKHEECEKCQICDRPFNTNKESKYYHNFKKVRDHCHYTGKYRGVAHSLCNLR